MQQVLLYSSWHPSEFRSVAWDTFASLVFGVQSKSVFDKTLKAPSSHVDYGIFASCRETKYS
eukprot:6197508-Pleurochrysis_carterae.AAC.8